MDENAPEEKLPEIRIPDLNLPAVIDIESGVLDVRDIPPKAMMVLGLRALGLGYFRIAKTLGCAETTVRKYCTRYDPNDVCRIDDKQKRAITTTMLMSVSVEALMHITTDKLKATNAKDLAAIASRCATTAEKLNLMSKIPEDTGKTSRLDAMMDLLDDAEVEEV